MLIMPDRFVVNSDKEAKRIQFHVSSGEPGEKQELKEEVPVDASISMTLTQLTLIWILLGCLIGWTIIFAVLALRPEQKKSEASVQASHTRYTRAGGPAVVQVLAKGPAGRQGSNGQMQSEVKEVHSVSVHS